jgi:hypothetical protein
MTKLVFKGAVHYSQWIKFVLITALVVVAFLNTDFDAKGSFIVVPGLLLMGLLSKYRAKLTIDQGKVIVSQFENRHDFDLTSIRRVERIEYKGWKKFFFPVDGIHIFYNRIEDVIFHPKDLDMLFKTLTRMADKELEA